MGGDGGEDEVVEEEQDQEQRGLVQRLSQGYTGKQRRHLRGLGHSLKPVVLVGQRGISENLLHNVDEALEAHELIKVKLHDPDEMAPTAEAISQATGAALVQKIGSILLFYRPRKKDPEIVLPR